MGAFRRPRGPSSYRSGSNSTRQGSERASFWHVAGERKFIVSEGVGYDHIEFLEGEKTTGPSPLFNCKGGRVWAHSTVAQHCSQGGGNPAQACPEPADVLAVSREVPQLQRGEVVRGPGGQWGTAGPGGEERTRRGFPSANSSSGEAIGWREGGRQLAGIPSRRGCWRTATRGGAP